MSDAAASVALNRFGLGGRPGDDPGGDPRRWLTAQLKRFEPRPASLDGVATSMAVVTAIRDYREQARLLRAQFGPGKGAVPPGTTPAAPAIVPPPVGPMPVGPMPAAPMRAGAAMPPMPPMPAPAAAAENDPLTQLRRDANEQARKSYVAMVGARAATAVMSDTPFVERLVHFWANHFAVSADNMEMTALAGTLEFEAIRPHVLGRFGDMLDAVERHPAMLVYLNQAESVGPNSPYARRAAGRGRTPGLNENLAREILELHTLGVRSGYSQADVTEFARALTGWTAAGMRGGRDDGSAPGSFRFVAALHEPGDRMLLGRRFAEAGEAQAAAVLDLVATHPATARHIATKLARHFAADDPPPSLVARLEKRFLETGGDLPSLYAVLIGARECWAPAPAKFKTPWEWTISAMRALGTDRVEAQPVQGLLVQLGQPVWKPGSPAGWDDIAPSWAGPDAVMRRVEAAQRLAQRLRSPIDARARAAALFPGALGATSAQAIARAESPAQATALMLVTPEFMRR